MLDLLSPPTCALVRFRLHAWPAVSAISGACADLSRQFFFYSVNRKVIRDRLVIWALKGLFLGILLGVILGDFWDYFLDFGVIFLIKALLPLESSGA